MNQKQNGEAKKPSDGSTRKLLDRFKSAVSEADELLANDQHQQAMALYYEASQSADEMSERFLTLLVRTSPNNDFRTLLIEVISWRLRYITAQYDYHLAVAQTLGGLPRQEWIARLETLLVLAQTWVDKLLPFQKEVNEPGLKGRIDDVLSDWVAGIRSLIDKLMNWGMASAQASRVLEWAMDNGLE